MRLHPDTARVRKMTARQLRAAMVKAAKAAKSTPKHMMGDADWEVLEILAEQERRLKHNA